MTVETHDKLVRPAVLEVRYAGGATRRLVVPVETWQLRYKAVISLPGPAVVSAMIEPDHRLPDRGRADDSFRPAPPAAR